jgi:acyl-CoA dehydrogenase
MLLGAGDAGTALGFTTGRIGIAAMGTGLGQACVDASTKYMQETQRWGKPLASFQLVQNMLVNMAVETDCARYLYLRACNAADGLERGGQLVAESTRDPRVGELRLYSSMAKYFCCDAANRTAYNAVSIHGASGVLEDLRIERYYRDARMLNIPDGTSEIQRLIIARELTGINAIR